MLSLFRKKQRSETGKSFLKKIQKMTGLLPRKHSVYTIAFTHTSSIDTEDKSASSNERLEFLGDAVLDAVVAEYLFKKFPYQSEGFLTELRSRIVKRDTLNHISRKMGIDEIMFMGKSHKTSISSILGNALEALIGAVFLDYGYAKTRSFIEKKIIIPFIDIDEFVSTTDNFKSLLLEWGDQHDKDISFVITHEVKHKSYTDFFAQVKVNGRKVGEGIGNSKKKAEQAAAEHACEKLKLHEQ